MMTAEILKISGINYATRPSLLDLITSLLIYITVNNKNKLLYNYTMEATPRQNPLEGRLVEGQKAADYFDAQGKSSGIFSGRKTTRLEITGLSGERFKLAADLANRQQEKLADGTVVKQRGSSYVVISVKDGEKTQKVLLNINSAAKRLHLTSKEVTEFAKGEHRKKVQTVAQSYEKFDTIIAQYEQSWGPFATAKGRESGHDSGISMRTLRKTVAVALTTPINSGIYLIRLGDTNVVVQREVGGAIRDISVQSGQFLGAGGYGTVNRLFSLTTAAQGEALKTPTSNQMSSEALRAMARGRAILREIHKDGRVPGIQEAPHLVFAHVRDPITGETGPKKVVASISRAFEGDLRAGFSPPEIDFNAPEIAPPPLAGTSAQVRTEGCQTLLQGLVGMHAKDIVHGDIKPSNVLYRKTTGRLELEIIDFDGARFLKRIKDEQGRDPSLDVSDQDFLGINTPGYLSSVDVAKIKETRRNQNRTRFNELQKKRDVFALGITCFGLLTKGRRAFTRTASGQINRIRPEQYQTMLIEAGVGEGVAKVVVKMLNEDPDQRPDSATCLQQLEAAMAADPTSFPAQ